MQTLLRGGMVFDGHCFTRSDIVISDGIIACVVPSGMSLDQAPEADTDHLSGIGHVIDIDNRYVFPGFTDVHVHFREPGFSYKEDIASGTAAAAAGGYTDVCTMPNLDPVPDSPANLSVQLEAIKKDALIGVHPYGSLTVGELGRELSDIEGIARDVIAFSDDGRGVADAELMRSAMKRVAAAGRLIAAHCEDMTVIGGAHVHNGKVAERLGIAGITSESEWRMIARDAELAKETGCPYHVCHVSTKRSVDIIRRAKAEGADITCETAPHYLLLDEDDILRAMEAEDSGSLGRFKMNPPLRSAADKEALLEGLADGTIDMIATDHAPHSSEEKARGLLGAPMGVVGLECAFPVLYTGLVKKNIISLEKLVSLMSTAPAARFGLGCGIEAGRPADLCVYDLEGEYAVSPDTFMSKGRYTPFDGMTVSARCVMTFKNGEPVWDRRELEH